MRLGWRRHDQFRRAVLGVVKCGRCDGCGTAAGRGTAASILLLLLLGRLDLELLHHIIPGLARTSGVQTLRHGRTALRDVLTALHGTAFNNERRNGRGDMLMLLLGRSCWSRRDM